MRARWRFGRHSAMTSLLSSVILFEVRGVLCQEDPAEEPEGIGNESAEIGALCGKPSHQAEGGRRILIGDGGGEAGERVAVGETERSGDRHRRRRFRPRARRPARGGSEHPRTEPPGMGRDHGQPIGPGIEALPACDVLQIGDQRLGGNGVGSRTAVTGSGSCRAACTARWWRGTKMTCSGGSSSVLSRALPAALESMCASSRMYTRCAPAAAATVPTLMRDLPDVLDLVVRRGIELDDVDRCPPSAIPRQETHSLSGSPSGCRLVQFNDFASRRADVVLPVPRGPANR